MGDRLRRATKALGRLDGEGVKGELRTHCCSEGEKHCRPGRVGDAEPPAAAAAMGGQGEVAEERVAAARPMLRCRGSLRSMRGRVSLRRFSSSY